MINNLSSRVLSGVGSQVYTQIVAFAVQIIAVPVLLYGWGTEQYGEWLLITTIPSYLAMSDMGFIGVGIREITILRSKGESEEALSVFQSVFLLLNVLFVFLMLVFIPIALNIDAEATFQISKLSASEFKHLIIVFCIIVYLNMQSSLMASGLISEGYYGHAAYARNTILLMDNVTLWLFAGFGSSPSMAATAMLISRLSGLIFFRLYILRKAPWMVYGLGHCKFSTLKRLLSPSLSATIVTLSNIFNLQGMRLIVGALYDPTTVVLFATLRTLTRFATSIFASINRIVDPEMGRAFGQQDVGLMRSLHRRSTQLALWLGIGVAFGMVAFGDFILEHWTHGMVQMNHNLFYVLIGTAVANALWSTSITVPFATNRLGLTSTHILLANTAGMALAYAIGGTMDVAVPCSMLLLIEILAILIVLPNSIRLTEDSTPPFILRSVTPPFYLLNYVGPTILKLQNKLSAKRVKP
ncbi:MAG: lipopolysaccharide biosynthesis protein [Okeania sp. SIO3B3]|nr:lipopolysaccharide biosynthesis protein [Okeania sp. SIO3B3]